jgi:hypothetical protein
VSILSFAFGGAQWLIIRRREVFEKRAQRTEKLMKELGVKVVDHLDLTSKL